MFCLYPLTHFSQLQMSFLDVQVFVLPGKQTGRKRLEFLVPPAGETPPCSGSKTQRRTHNIWDANTPTEPIHRLEIELVLKCLGGLRL